MHFEDLGLCEPILRAVAAEGYKTPTPIQAQAVPHVLRGSDLLGCAQTGTGKTAAFAMPILHRLSTGQNTDKHSRLRALVLAPTRELASQIGDSFRAYGRNLRLRHAVVFGGVSQHHQVKALKAGLDVLIATPGRLLDLMNQGFIDLRAIEIFVLDEADRMLDMGFIPDIRRIVSRLPQKRQTLMYSATMPTEIRQLAAAMLHNPVHVAVNPVASTAESIEQSVYFVPRNNKTALLTHLLKHGEMGRTLVFTRTKHGADKVVKHLDRAGIRAAAIHGNKSQNNRNRALAAFKSKSPPVLVATDIASRGIDVDEITHVINFDIPEVAETYVHRIGRTARAGASGVAVSFCDHEERADLKAIERLIRRPIAVNSDQPGLTAQQHQPREDMAVQHSAKRDKAGASGRRGAWQTSARPARSGKAHRGQPVEAVAHNGDRPAARKANQGWSQRGRGRPRSGRS